jgi:hypothetical protein
MQDTNEGGGGEAGTGSEQTSRPQQAGEGGTTRLGMEDGDNTDIPATGGPQADDEDEQTA